MGFLVLLVMFKSVSTSFVVTMVYIFAIDTSLFSQNNKDWRFSKFKKKCFLSWSISSWSYSFPGKNGGRVASRRPYKHGETSSFAFVKATIAIATNNWLSSQTGRVTGEGYIILRWEKSALHSLQQPRLFCLTSRESTSLYMKQITWYVSLYHLVTGAFLCTTWSLGNGQTYHVMHVQAVCWFYLWW